MNHWIVPVLESAVICFCVLYEATNTVNIEVNVKVHMSCLVHLDDTFAFVI